MADEPNPYESPTQPGITVARPRRRSHYWLMVLGVTGFAWVVMGAFWREPLTIEWNGQGSQVNGDPVLYQHFWIGIEPHPVMSLVVAFLLANIVVLLAVWLRSVASRG